MCGRFAQATALEKIRAFMDITGNLDLDESYNVAPSQTIATIIQDGQHQKHWMPARWGLIPSWAKDAKIAYKLINARAETLCEKPSYRNAFKLRRCVVPIDGFYEWTVVGGKKQPFYIHDQNEAPLLLAGLWESWHKDNDAIISCTIVTTVASPKMQVIHERMPAILSAEECDIWLDGTIKEVDQLQSLLKPTSNVIFNPVSALVNSPKYNSPDCIHPIN